MKKSLELCCGHASFSQVASREFGYHTTTLDIDPFFTPDICCDVRQWEYAPMFPPDHFSVVWASPPCTEFSHAKSVGVRDLPLADSIAQACLAIVRYFDCPFVIENPYSGLLRHRPYMAGVPYHRVDYCAYEPSLGMKKSTVLFTNLTDFIPLTCPGRGQCLAMEGSCHRNTATGNYFPWSSKKQRARELARVPANLVRSILRHPSSHA